MIEQFFRNQEIEAENEYLKERIRIMEDMLKKSDIIKEQALHGWDESLKRRNALCKSLQRLQHRVSITLAAMFILSTTLVIWTLL